MRRRTFLSLVPIAGAVPAGQAFAQGSAPVPGPVKIVVGFSPGGGTDVVARLLAQKLATLWGVPVVVENRDGASGVLASRVVAKLPVDGTTLLMANFSSHSGAPALNPNVGYDYLKDFTPITLVGVTPCVLLCKPDQAARTLADVIAACRNAPGTVTFGSAGIGSVQHLAMEMFKLQAKVEALHVPYKGSGPMLADLMGGQIAYSWENMASAIPYVKQGRLVAVAQACAKRLKQVADVPTTAELGYGDFQAATWYGLVGPGHMAAGLTQRINEDVVKVMAMPDVVAMLDNLSAEGGGGAPDRFAQFMKEEYERWAKVVKDAKLTMG